MNAIFTHWKTTVAGVVLLAAVGGFFLHQITLEQLIGVATTAAGAGFLAAGDGTK